MFNEVVRAIRQDTESAIFGRYQYVVSGKPYGDNQLILRDSALPINQMYAHTSDGRYIYVVKGMVAKAGVPIQIKRLEDGTWILENGDFDFGTSVYGDKYQTVLQPPIASALDLRKLDGINLRPGSGRAGVTGGLYAVVEEHVFLDTNNVPTRFVETETDLSASVPGTADTHRLVGVAVIRATGAVHTVNGSTQSAFVDFTLADAIALTDSTNAYAWRFAVRLRNGQTQITETDFIDLRPHFGDGERRHNLTAGSAPTSGDNAADGYGIGSLWLITSSLTLYVCTAATSSTATWEIVASGSGSPVDILGTYYEPKAPPVSPSANDDEMDDSSFNTTLWATDFDPDSAFTRGEDAKGAYLSISATAGITHGAFAQALPAGAFSIETPVFKRHRNGAVAAFTGGLVLLENATSGADFVDFVHVSGTNTYALEVQRWTDRNTNAAVPYAHTADQNAHGARMRIRYDGSAFYYFDYDEGNGAGFINVYSTNSLGVTPTLMGCICGTSAITGTEELRVYFSYFRYTNSDVGLFGEIGGRRVAYIVAA